MRKQRIELWTVRHPDTTKGWIYLSEAAAVEALKKTQKKLKKTQPQITIQDFIIEPYNVLDEELLYILRESLPELFL